MSGTLLDLARLQIEERHRESDERAQTTLARKRQATTKPASFLRRLTRTTPKAA